MKTMRQAGFRWLVGTLMGVVLAGAAQASVLFSQAALAGGEAYVSTQSSQSAESFALGGVASVTGLRWYGTDAANSDFVVRFFDSNPMSASDAYSTKSGVAGATITRSALPVLTYLDLNSDPLPIFEFEMTLASAVSTAVNQTIFVSIFNTDASQWGWAESSVGDGVSLLRGGDGEAWGQDVPGLSLIVLGTRAGTDIPEPTTLALVALALALTTRVRRTR